MEFVLVRTRPAAWASGTGRRGEEDARPGTGSRPGTGRNLMERVMDEAAACADNNGRITIKSGNIMTSSKLAMHQVTGPYGGGCPEIEKSK